MNKEISKIVKHLIDNYYDTTPDKKYLSIEIYNELKFDDGNIKIEATGNWMKDFNMQKFQGEVWNLKRKPIFVHVGNTHTHELYEVDIAHRSTLHFEDEPYVKDCEYYVSFVFEIQRGLKDRFPVIKKYIMDLASEHSELRIKLMGNDEFWEEDKKVEKCINMIGESISTILTHQTFDDSRVKLFQSMNVSTSNEAVDEFKKIVSLRLLDYEKNKI